MKLRCLYKILSPQYLKLLCVLKQEEAVFIFVNFPVHEYLKDILDDILTAMREFYVLLDNYHRILVFLHSISQNLLMLYIVFNLAYTFKHFC